MKISPTLLEHEVVPTVGKEGSEMGLKFIHASLKLNFLPVIGFSGGEVEDAVVGPGVEDAGGGR